jgi:hypothetical protein
MTEREKELLELERILFPHMCHANFEGREVAKEILQAGYTTKKCFPIKKLEVWLEKGIEVAEKRTPSKWVMVEVQISAVKKILDKIKELKGE